ncbi:MAG: sulfite exporter TauE/SafE family protein [Chloroflexi bacterium]|nr:sulfite exporter TauE/SafE family protein [Chloroflexota bacterium]
MTGNLSLLVAFGAGVLSFVSPCVLPLVPAYIGMLSGTSVGDASRVRTLVHAIAFITGFSAVFVTLGASVSLIGFVFQDLVRSLAFRIVAGAVLIGFGLHGAGLLRFNALYRDTRFQIRPGVRASLVKSFVIGAAFASGWTPCIGPILGTILLYASTEATVLQGAALLSAYSLGLGVPFFLTGLALEASTRLMRRLNRRARLIELSSGALMVGMGLVVMSGGMTWFAGFLSELGFQGV